MKQNILILLLLFFTFNTLIISKSLAQEVSYSPVYRFWSDLHQSHFFTISEAEKNEVIAKYPDNIWKYEGIAYQAFKQNEDGLIPIYRFWSDQNQSHFYTSSEAEKNQVISNYDDYIWKYEGVAYYAYPSIQTDTASIFRFWSDQNQSHFYTGTPNEKNCILNKYPENIWKYEGISWYVPSIGLNLADDPSTCFTGGPEIKVGVWNYDRDDIRSGTGSIQLSANNEYSIKDINGDVITKIPANTETKVQYTSDGNLAVSGTNLIETIVGSEITFESSTGNVNTIFETNAPRTYVKYRGKIRLKYSDTTNNLNLTGESKRIWMINILPMEHYVWGMGEITGTGPMEYNKVMTISFRTYGYFWLHESTKYIPEGFTVNATPGNQLYYGYDYEVKYPRIREAAQYTRGNILTHPNSIFESKVAITPYSSWTDGRTRSFEERWGSTLYPWNQSVSDPYGKHPYLSTTELENAGNHMVGLSANGALSLAKNHGWKYQNIMKYYYTGVNFLNLY